jgi:hypothetical protein
MLGSLVTQSCSRVFNRSRAVVAACAVGGEVMGWAFTSYLLRRYGRAPYRLEWVTWQWQALTTGRAMRPMSDEHP